MRNSDNDDNVKFSSDKEMSLFTKRYNKFLRLKGVNHDDKILIKFRRSTKKK